MASRPTGYGLTAELQGKTAAKFDSTLAQQALDWLRTVSGEPLPVAGKGVSSDSFHETLKDGIILLKAMNGIRSKKGKPAIKINTNKMAFKQMENIGNFLDACGELGVAKNDLFQTVDLYEGQNIPQVVSSIHALGRKAQSIPGIPGLGPKEAQANKREFTQEQLRAGQGVIGLQMGSNKGATQAGQNFGKTRSIMD